MHTCSSRSFPLQFHPAPVQSTGCPQTLCSASPASPAAALPAERATTHPPQSPGEACRPPAPADSSPIPDTGPHSADTVVSPGASNQPLPACQRQKFRVRRQDLAHRILVSPPRSHLLSDFVRQMLRDVLDVLLAVRHVGERPLRVTLAFGAMTVRPATAVVLKRERTRQQILRNLESAYQFELALTDSSRLGSFGFSVHRIVLLHADAHKSNPLH